MTPKQILLVLDADTPADAATSLAAEIAAGAGGCVGGVCLFREPDPSIADCYAIGPEAVGEVVERLKIEIRDDTAAACKAFRHAVTSRGLSESWRLAAISDWRSALLGASHIADLIVAPAAGDRHDFRAVTVDLLLQSGAPCLIAPAQVGVRAPFRRVALGWNGSREAARAMRDGMEFLRAASEVIVLVAAEEKTQWIDQANTEGLVKHLARHGVHAGLEQVADRGGRAVGEALISQCEEFGADLFVMGGYGHSQAAETFLGGATQTLLKHAPFAVLMSH